jgi:hypothetical protein
VTIEGAPLAIQGAAIRATLELDLDGDADRDVLALALAPGVAPAPPSASLVVALRGPDGLHAGAPAALALPATATACALEAPRLAAPSPALLVASARAACATAPTEIAWIVRPGAAPRVIASLALVTAPGDSLTVRAEDRDADGHDDLVAHVSLHDASGESADVPLVWLDRAAGLSRDTSEPEHAITTAAGEGRTALRRHPERALAAATTAHLVHDALCGPGARLVIDGTVGLACGASSGYGRALAIEAAARARTGDLEGALRALAHLGDADVTVRDADRTTAREAILGTSGVLRPAAITTTAAARPVSSSTARLSSLAFLTDDRVLVRGDGAREIALTTGAETPSVDADARLLDPSREHVVVDLERRCDGVSLVLGPALDALAGPDARTYAPIEPPAPGVARDPAPPCTELPPEQREDDSGFRALGWAPQGVLVARGSALVVVPLDVSAHPLGDASAVTDAPPAPIAPGCASADASVWVGVTPIGLVVRRLGQPPELVVPEGFTHADGTDIDAAISPSGRRLAWIEGGVVRWTDLDAPPPPTPGGP